MPSHEHAGFDSGSQIGFAAAYRAGVSEAAEMRSRGAERVRYPWPGMEIVRRISVPDAGSEWKRFADGVDSRTSRIGNPVPFKQMEVTYVTADEMSTLMDVSRPKIAASPDRHRRNAAASEVAELINGRIEAFHEEEFRAQDMLLYHERQRPEVTDEAYESMHFTETGEQQLPELTLPEEVPQMWGKLYAPVSGVDTSGPRSVSLSLEDPSQVMRRGRDELLTMMHDMRLKVAEARIEEDWQPEMTILETYSRTPVHRLALKLPAVPAEVPLKPPHMYVEPVRDDRSR